MRPQARLILAGPELKDLCRPTANGARTDGMR